MKGLSHFVSALAAATFIPGVITQSAETQSLILLLAGVCGVLPDWLDFKFARYFEPAEVHLEPTALNFNAPALAEQTARAIERAYTEQRPIAVQFYSAQLAPDRWRRYTVQFAPATNEVVIRPGPIINSGGFALAEVGQPGEVGRAPVGPQLSYTYDGEMRVETMEGPSFEFRREGDEVEVSFLAWHRRWSHSLVLAAVCGLACGAVWGETAGWVAAVAFATHVLEDQLGHLGSNLWWPFTARRGAGLKLMHSGDPLPNFVTVLISCGLMLYNMNRFASPSLYDGNLFLLWGVALPAFAGLVMYAAGKHPPQRLEAWRGQEALEEAEETEVN